MRLNDLISRQEAINKILGYFIEYHGGAFREDDQRALIEVFEKIPTVDAVPVRHGKWVDTETFKRPWFRHHIFECSVCRNTLDMDGVNAGRGDANYCPNCGAKMDGERKEE